MALIANPQYTLPTSGVTFDVEPVPPLLLQRFLIEWQKQHPKPVPPLTEIDIAGKKIAQTDAKDPYFIMLLEDWSAQQNTAVMDFILAYGVKNNPPQEWIPDPIFHNGHLPDYQRKAIWISTFVKSLADLEGLREAIESLNNITTEGIEAEKNAITPSLAVVTSSVAPSSPDPTP